MSCFCAVLLKRLSVSSLSSVFHHTDRIIPQNSTIWQARKLSTTANSVSYRLPACLPVGIKCKRGKTRPHLLRTRNTGALLSILQYSTLPEDMEDDRKPAGYDIESVRSVLEKYNEGSVDLEKEELSGIAVVTLNNPGKRNAVSGKMMCDLADIVEELEHWNLGKGLILRGQGNFFCAGADLDMVRDSFQNLKISNMMTDIMHNVTTRLLTLPMISVALIEGGALGGGAELTTCCDFRLATKNCKIGFIHLSLGVVPGWGGGTRLAKILGRTKALELLCCGQMLTSRSALELGLINGLISDSDQSLQEAKEWLSKYTRWDVQAMRAAKQVIHTASNSSLSESLANERTCFSRVWGNPTHRQAILGLNRKQ